MSNFNIKYDPFIEDLCRFLEMTTASTYPTITLKRRLQLLSKTELEYCERCWRRIENLAEKIEGTIAERAELENDKWP